MTDDYIKQLLAAYKALNIEGVELASKMASELKSADLFELTNPGMRTLIEEINSQDEMRKYGHSSFSDIVKASRIHDPAINVAAEIAQGLLVDYESSFRLPEGVELDSLVSGFHIGGLAEIHQAGLKDAMEAMSSPWLKVGEVAQSLSGFAELQGIGRELSVTAAFDTDFTNLLRKDLGDWRDKISWPENIFSDAMARTEFYVDRGFNTNLTNFPATSFHESLDIAGLRRPLPILVEEYGSPVSPSENDDDERGYIRTNTAHDWLQRLEGSLRLFIDKSMTAKYGKDWARHKLPNGLYDQWLEKQQNANHGEAKVYPIIAYADFRDYESVICKKDNWREVFHVVFTRMEDVRESLQRLYPIRIITMHARQITRADELILYIEARRITEAIQRMTV